MTRHISLEWIALKNLIRREKYRGTQKNRSILKLVIFLQLSSLFRFFATFLIPSMYEFRLDNSTLVLQQL